MLQTLRGRLALSALLLAPFVVTPAFAQGPTPEGTVITNTATASWTDANSNTYTSVSASASVTVGFLAGVDAASAVSVTPASPSTGNTLPFTIQNIGNGVDSVKTAWTVGAGVTITGYTLGATTYATLAELNFELSKLPVPRNGTVTVTVVYTVAPGRGGLTSPVSLTATSLRTTTVFDATTTNIIPPVSAAVSVTPDGGTVQRLPSNGTQYSQVYTITNNGNASDTYTLTSSVAGAVLSIVTTNGAAGTGSSVTIAAGGSTTATVVYTVGDVAAGSTEALTLSATSGNNAAISDAGYYTISVIRAAITMTKVAYKNDQTTLITASDRVLPGDYIWYRMTVTNAGGATANNVSISDPLPAQVTYVSTAADAAGWTIAESSGTVTASLASLAPSASRYMWVRVRVQ